EIRTTSEGSGRVKIPLQLNTSSGKDVSVSYELSGLAINGQDYSVISDSTIVFPAGTTEQFLELNIVQDDVPEGGETIKIKL
ncbi:Calx-beta domain-containing protein, partial [Vibrio parahaemolyticus]